MRDKVAQLIGSEARLFCTRLWYELTIAGRAIWSDERLNEETKLNALKWLNDIQHRVWVAHAREDEEALVWLLDRIMSHCEQAPVVAPHVRIALDRSLAAITNLRQDPEP